MHFAADDKQKLLRRLKKAEGQVAAIRRMVEQDADCVAALTQVAAARGALARAGDVILRNHIDTCVATAIEAGDVARREAKLDELMTTIRRFSGGR